ncbi:hypothetical protein GKQ38_03100 [Candidatus Nanohaloarchaea archaeon]|nr:hypothetical protein GKQ38_03100 [Candidatus Nanohaloarchaea archaeon]
MFVVFSSLLGLSFYYTSIVYAALVTVAFGCLQVVFLAVDSISADNAEA